MDDLNGLDWSSKPTTGQSKANYQSSAFSSLKPTPPASGRASPFPQSTSPVPAPKPTASANDSFSNLVAFSSAGINKNLSLQEQQKRLAELKLQQLTGNKQAIQNEWAGSDDVWNNLGSGRSTPALQTSAGSQIKPTRPAEEEDDLFAAFTQPATNSKPPKSQSPPQQSGQNDDDDDPFGLSDFQARNKAAATTATQPSSSITADDDDILGDLGKPVTERPPPQRQPSPQSNPSKDHPQDKAVAELVEMGFPVEKARQALESTDSGVNVQAAVGILLNQAHAESQQKSRSRNQARPNGSPDEDRPVSKSARSRQLNSEDGAAMPGQDRSSTPSNDSTKVTNDFGSTFMKTAGSFWKQAQKQVQQAVQDFNSDSESNQPKWMREASAPRSPQDEDQVQESRRRRRSSGAKKQASNVTDEAMMLESERPTPPPRQVPRSRPERAFDSSADNSRDHSPAMPSRLRESHSPQPAFMKSQAAGPAPMRQQPQPPAPRSMLSRQAAEDQASQAYVSSARRRKAPAAPALEPDLMEASKPSNIPGRASAPPTSKPSQTQSRPKPVKPVVVRPQAPKRDIPTVNAISLKASHKARVEGNEHFKRGDYSSAHASYATSLSHLPKTHPLTIVLLTNHALTALKVGEPKIAITDSDSAITIIGLSKGESETVDFANGEPPKPMRDYYGKALMRKAEALEQMEKWVEAAAVWKVCVEDGHGGAQAIQARSRAEKAAQPKVAPRPAAKKPVTKPPPRPNVLAKSDNSAAVTRLRAANAASERADDEKFALSDSVDARIHAWRGGKADNLRALLASLDTVLWPEAKEGWKKISMADLVLPPKVKISYMKGIAKVHPDKIPTDATTEQRMVAGAVFSTLNEAWDKFKTENGL